MAVGREDLERLAALVKAACGVVVAIDKPSVIESRLGAVARRETFPSVEALLKSLVKPRDQALVRAVVVPNELCGLHP